MLDRVHYEGPDPFRGGRRRLLLSLPFMARTLTATDLLPALAVVRVCAACDAWVFCSLLMLLPASEQTPWLDDKHVVFGEVIDGARTVKDIELLGSNSGKTSKPVRALAFCFGFDHWRCFVGGGAMVRGSRCCCKGSVFCWLGFGQVPNRRFTYIRVCFENDMLWCSSMKLHTSAVFTNMFFFCSWRGRSLSGTVRDSTPTTFSPNTYTHLLLYFVFMRTT